MDSSVVLSMVNMVMMMMLSDRALSPTMVVGMVMMVLPQLLPALVEWLKRWWYRSAQTYSVSINSRLTPEVFRAATRMVHKHIVRQVDGMVVGATRKFSGAKRSALTSRYMSRYIDMPVVCPTGVFECAWGGVRIQGWLKVRAGEKETVMDMELSVPSAQRGTLEGFLAESSRDAWEEETLKRSGKPGKQVAFSLRLRDQRVSWRPTFMSVTKTFDTLWLPRELHAAIVDDLDSFMRSAPFYRERALPHKRGMLFYGPPGTGKSSCIYAIASRLRYDVYRVSVRTCTNPDILKRALTKIKEAAVVVVEEVDLELAAEFCYLAPPPPQQEGGAPPAPTEKDKSKLSVLMEYLDGYVAHCPGTVVIFTTNHKDDIPAPLIRPGRIDRHFLFGPLAGRDVARVARNFTGMPNLQCPDITIPAAELINTALLPHIGDARALQASMNGLAGKRAAGAGEGVGK